MPIVASTKSILKICCWVKPILRDGRTKNEVSPWCPQPFEKQALSIRNKRSRYGMFENSWQIKNGKKTPFANLKKERHEKYHHRRRRDWRLVANDFIPSLTTRTTNRWNHNNMIRHTRLSVSLLLLTQSIKTVASSNQSMLHRHTLSCCIDTRHYLILATVCIRSWVGSLLARVDYFILTTISLSIVLWSSW